MTGRWPAGTRPVAVAQARKLLRLASWRFMLARSWLRTLSASKLGKEL
jgi:hypothetical protein